MNYKDAKAQSSRIRKTEKLGNQETEKPLDGWPVIHDIRVIRGGGCQAPDASREAANVAKARMKWPLMISLRGLRGFA
jgi:hypothetical protein